MSYPGYTPNLGFSGRQETPQPGFQLPNPPYPSGNVGQPSYPIPNLYPSNQPSYPQPSPYPPQIGPYPPQYPSQQQCQFQLQSSPYAPTPYPPSTLPGQYSPQVSPYSNVQPPSGYAPQFAYSQTQQVPPVYPLMSAGTGYEDSFYAPPQADYPPIRTSAHYEPLSSSIVKKKLNPTVNPANPFDPRHDAEILRKAMKGFGTDEKAIINVLARRVNSQRQEIAVHFKTMYGKDLVSDLKSELSGKFEDLIVALMTPTYDFLAKELHHAIDGFGTNEETLIEIICSASNSEIHNIKMAYQKLYQRNLENDLEGDTSGSFRRLLVSLCQGCRSEDTHVDIASAQSDAQNLYQAGENRFGTDESTFNMILCSRSYSHLQQVFSEYHRLTGQDFENAIKSEFSGDIENGLLAIVQSVKDRCAYFAKRLHESMAGFGTNDRALIRIVATRCEIDMVQIKNAYTSMYGTSLEADIKDDTSGDYKKCLIELVVG